jgi:hypothetical protein
MNLSVSNPPQPLPLPTQALKPEQVWETLTSQQQQAIFQTLTHLCQLLASAQQPPTKAISHER